MNNNDIKDWRIWKLWSDKALNEGDGQIINYWEHILGQKVDLEFIVEYGYEDINAYLKTTYASELKTFEVMARVLGAKNG